MAPNHRRQTYGAIINGRKTASWPPCWPKTPACAIINTGSKQGKSPIHPATPAYAIAKIRRPHPDRTTRPRSSRKKAGARVSAHLLIPGWTFTGLTKTTDGKKNPPVLGPPSKS